MDRTDLTKQTINIYTYPKGQEAFEFGVKLGFAMACGGGMFLGIASLAINLVRWAF